MVAARGLEALIALAFVLNVAVMRYVVSFLMVASLAGCSGGSPKFLGKWVKSPVLGEPEPAAPVGEGNPFDVAMVAPEPAETAVTVEALDTTTPEQRAAAVETVEETPAEGDGRLGTTVASIGDPGEPGFWIKTPLVSEATSGRIVYLVSGRSVQVQMIPSGGATGSGSQVSLAAMRLLDAPLAGLPELVVYKN